MASPPTTTTDPSASSATPSLSTAAAALSRFQSIRQSIAYKFRSSKQQERPAFPPGSWSLDTSKNDGTGATQWTYGDPSQWAKEIEQIREQTAANSDTIATTPPLPAPDPTSLAHRIRNLIQAQLSSISAPSTPLPSADNKFSDPVVKDGGDEPDPNLVQLLSSEPVMNGGPKGNDSIWSILERLGPKKKVNTPEVASTPDEGVMLYAPLSPTPESELEIAESDVTLEYIDAPQEDAKKDANDQAEPAKDGPKVVERREWRPSGTKLSLQATWWGYRLYIPPPILEILSDAQLAAAKRGAMVTTALKWMLDKIPLMLFPPQLRPAVMILKRLTPYLGYVGGFVAWSWERVKKKDKGQGVVLSATWLVPIALVPATWDLEIHGHPKASEVPNLDRSQAEVGNEGGQNKSKKK